MSAADPSVEIERTKFRAYKKNVKQNRTLPLGKPENWPESTQEEVAELPARIINVASEQKYMFCDNKIKTSKYEMWSFLPKFLLEEFNPRTKVANSYFLFIAALQCIPAISNTNGLPTFLLPLTVVVFIDGLFQALEDMNRHRADHQANITPANCWNASAGQFEVIPRSELYVGDIVRIDNRKEIPADCVILAVKEKELPAQGLCFVETKQLDGETNLKSRMALPNTLDKVQSDNDLKNLIGTIKMEHPNNLVESFTGTIDLGDSTFSGQRLARKPIQPNNILLRGCVLRNTDYVYGIVVNSGHDTKIMMNSIAAKPKSSDLESKASNEVKKIMVLLFLICFVGATGQASWNKDNKLKEIWYLGYADEPELTNWFISFFYFFLLHASCIPVSLYVSMSIIRAGQMYFMNCDYDMYYEKTNTFALVRTMTLNEELGQISHIFSDKTGTLTCNRMDFRKMSINGIQYGRGITEIGRASWLLQGKTISEEQLEGERLANELCANDEHVSFYCPSYEALMNEKKSTQKSKAKEFFRLLAICHDVIPERAGEVVKLSASNPDDEALTAASKYFGYSFEDRQDGKIVLATKEGNKQYISLLETIKFSSKRKRMSVIVRDPKDKTIKLFIKGADTVIIERLSSGQDELVGTTVDHMEEYSEEGLRCLLLGVRTLSEDEYIQWKDKYADASTSLEQLQLQKEGKPNKIEDLEEQIETGIRLLGCTAIEDKLQDGVPECIKVLAESGINIWVLTGDKQETAINIAVACNLLLPREYMDYIIINASTATTADEMTAIFEQQIALAKKETEEAAARHKKANAILHVGNTRMKPKALIIDGPSLMVALDEKHHPETKRLLLELSKFCQAVVGCRVSPDQKREMVNLVKVGIPTVRTLAIGDGANDVPMIQEAHIGVGIKGEEGLQAVNSSDYAIAQFRFLQHLLLKHGRYNYIRMSNLVCYIFYKNIINSVAMFWFNMYNGFSGQKMFAEGAIQMFNLLFTSLPILFYGIYDRDIPIKFVVAYPKIYLDGVHNKYFSTSVFWGWVTTAVWQSIICCVMSLLFMDTIADGGSFWTAGSLGYSSIVCVVNFKMMTFQSSWNLFHYFFLFGSIAFWFGFGIGLNDDMELSQFDWYSVFNNALSQQAFWVGLVWILVFVFSYETLFNGFWRAYFYDNRHILQEVRVANHRSNADGIEGGGGDDLLGIQPAMSNNNMKSVSPMASPKVSPSSSDDGIEIVKV